LAAYSRGTGVEIGIASACDTSAALGASSLNTSVESSGVSMPGMSLIAPSLVGTPTMSLK
jgi:hypothetical protein